MYGFENDGITASELIEQLQALIEKHGDGEVIISGGEYPDLCTGAYFNTSNDSYLARDTIVING